MKHILDPAHVSQLDGLARPDVLFTFDYDGTLAPIHPTPSAAGMRPRTHALLGRVASLYACAVVSGRAHADLAARVDGLPLWDIVGNHGLEPWSSAAVFEDRVRAWRAEMERGLAGMAGLFIEDKRFSLAVHFRHAADRVEAEAAIRSLAGALDGARVIGGKCVVNLVPRDAPDKGTAVEAMSARLGCTQVVYIGDDDSDEDVFARGGPQLLGIRVEEDPRSRAEYFLRDQDEVDELLARLVTLAVARPLPDLHASVG